METTLQLQLLAGVSIEIAATVHDIISHIDVDGFSGEFIQQLKIIRGNLVNIQNNTNPYHIQKAGYEVSDEANRVRLKEWLPKFNLILENLCAVVDSINEQFAINRTQPLNEKIEYIKKLQIEVNQMLSRKSSQ